MNPAMIVTRDVGAEEANNYAGADIPSGSVLYRFDGATYGCIAPGGIALSREPGCNPFFEFPVDAVRVMP